MNSTPKAFGIFAIRLLLLDGLILSAGSLLSGLTETGIGLIDIAILTLCFSIIVFLTFFIFLKGRKKNPESQTMHLFVAISLKMLLEMVFALFWFVIGKKSTLPLLLCFFVLYLAFSLFSVYFTLKSLRHRSL